MMKISPVFRFQPWPVAWAAALACACGSSAYAESLTPAQPLREVVVSASRAEQYTDELPVTVDVLDASKMERQQTDDIRDVAEDQVNLSVRHAPSRFALTGAANNTGREGNAGFSIRGMGGNRVLMLEDGIRIPHSYVYGGNAFGRDYLSLEMVKRIEIVRGPASALYGSEGMGGLVNFITWEPADLLKTPSGESKAVGGRVSASWSGDSDRFSTGAMLAGQASDSLQWLLALTEARSHGVATQGTNDAASVDRTTANPQIDRDHSWMGKLVWRPNGAQKHTLVLEHLERHSAVNLLSSRARLPLTGTAAQIAAAVLDERATNGMQRDRMTWDARYRLDSALADELQTVVGVQQAKSRQWGYSDLNTQADRVRDVRYEEKTWQLGAQAGKTVTLSDGWASKVTYGLEHVSSDIRNLVTGVSPLAPEVFPLKRFPDTRESASALYGQAEWLNDRWSVVPGVRVDHFALKVLTQDGFYPPAKLPAKSMSGSAVSPKLGLMYRTAPQWSVFGNLAAGFRAPNANQINGYYENSAEHVVVVPNPDLKPEKSRSLELGTRGRVGPLQLDAVAFTGRYTDLILDNVLIGGTGTAADPKLFQTINTDRARIHGFEVKGLYDAGNWAGGRVGVPFAYGQARGVNSLTGKPLNAIDPAHLLLGVSYWTSAWDLRLDAHHHAAKKAEDIDSALLVKTPNTQFTVPAATTFNLSGQWRIRRDLRLTASVMNLTNRKYWRWSDVQGLAASSTVTDAYSQPGRYLRLALVAEF